MIHCRRACFVQVGNVKLFLFRFAIGRIKSNSQLEKKHIKSVTNVSSNFGPIEKIVDLSSICLVEIW